MFSGSMAAGKSTTAALLAQTLRERGLSVAATSVDEVAEMALPTLPSWDWAHHVHAQLVGQWTRTGIDVVVDEGCSTLTGVEQVLAALPTGVSTLHAVLETSYDEALVRAQADPTRGLSRDPHFLREQYDDFARQVTIMPTDIHIQVSGITPEQVVRSILDRWDAR